MYWRKITYLDIRGLLWIKYTQIDKQKHSDLIVLEGLEGMILNFKWPEKMIISINNHFWISGNSVIA